MILEKGGKNLNMKTRELESRIYSPFLLEPFPIIYNAIVDVLNYILLVQYLRLIILAKLIVNSILINTTDAAS